MSDASIERLLQPSLDHAEPPARAPFSASAQFLTGVFGGPLGLVFCFVGSIHRLRRWRQDAVFLIVLTGILIGAVFLPQITAGAPLRAWLVDLLGRSGPGTWTTLCTSLAALAAIHRHHRQRRAADLMGLRVEGAFAACLAMVVVAAGLSYLFNAVMRMS
ncbi:hypothetical protein [Roseateles noduli]|uniref:hypothetical protein n=1 Tax=Roseateles noduli TaxID=2052484 RepID=UPI003D648127